MSNSDASGFVGSTNAADVAPAVRGRGIGRKVSAILAGGLVLGLGAAVTLAAWNDSEYATGTFTSGVFVFEGTPDVVNDPYAEHSNPGSAATLEFTVPAENLSPGDVVYAPYWVRLGAGTTSDATLDVAGVQTTDNIGLNSVELSYEIYQITPAATCDANATSIGSFVASATTLASGSPAVSDPTTLLNGSPSSNPGDPIQLCTIVTASNSLQQGGSTVSTWQFRVVAL